MHTNDGEQMNLNRIKRVAAERRASGVQIRSSNSRGGSPRNALNGFGFLGRPLAQTSIAEEAASSYVPRRATLMEQRRPRVTSAIRRSVISGIRLTSSFNKPIPPTYMRIANKYTFAFVRPWLHATQWMRAYTICTPRSFAGRALYLWARAMTF